jgi:preprotein translocase subunit YajC
VNGVAGLVPFLLIALVFYFLIIRPQRNRQKALASTQSTLGVGSEVMLGSGIYGTVLSLDDETMQLELSPGTQMKVARQAVVRVIDDPVPGDDQIGSDDRGDDDGFPGSTDPHQ